jgi:hypothetical protein
LLCCSFEKHADDTVKNTVALSGHLHICGAISSRILTFSSLVFLLLLSLLFILAVPGRFSSTNSPPPPSFLPSPELSEHSLKKRHRKVLCSFPLRCCWCHFVLVARAHTYTHSRKSLSQTFFFFKRCCKLILEVISRPLTLPHTHTRHSYVPTKVNDNRRKK